MKAGRQRLFCFPTLPHPTDSETQECSGGKGLSETMESTPSCYIDQRREVTCPCHRASQWQELEVEPRTSDPNSSARFIVSGCPRNSREDRESVPLICKEVWLKFNGSTKER